MIVNIRLSRWTGSYAVLIAALLTLASKGALAQIAPDDTLGGERSIVVPNLTIRGVESGSSASQSVRIDGGAIRGTNLFHSFSQFNIDQGRGAYFTNPTGITNK